MNDVKNNNEKAPISQLVTLLKDSPLQIGYTIGDINKLHLISYRALEALLNHYSVPFKTYMQYVTAEKDIGKVELKNEENTSLSTSQHAILNYAYDNFIFELENTFHLEVQLERIILQHQDVFLFSIQFDQQYNISEIFQQIDYLEKGYDIVPHIITNKDISKGLII